MPNKVMHYFTKHPRRFLLLVVFGYYVIGLVLTLALFRDDQADATMRQRVAELPESFPELIVASFFLYVILPLFWPSMVFGLVQLIFQ